MRNRAPMGTIPRGIVPASMESDTTDGMAAASAGAARILIVDDDETVLHTFSKALTLEGFDVRTAQSPLTGLQELDDVRPDVILLDLRMPFINGIGFLYRLRASETHRHIPVAI